MFVVLQNFIIVYITPPAIRNIGYRTYIIFAVRRSPRPACSSMTDS